MGMYVLSLKVPNYLNVTNDSIKNFLANESQDWFSQAALPA